MKKSYAAACAGLMCVAANSAWGAFGTDNVQLRVGAGLRYDSNVFRLPDGVQGSTADGKTGRSDYVSTLNVGASVTVPVSRQEFYLSGDVTRNRYNKFSTLDFDGQDLRGVWRWVLGPSLSGDLGASRAKYLSSFATTFGSNRNVRTSDQTFFTLNYPFHANWRATFGATDATLENSDPANRVSDSETTTRTAGLQYVSGSGNYVGVQGSTGETRFNNPFTLRGRVFDNSYDQDSVSAVLGYSPSGLTRLQGSVGRTRRQPLQPGQPEITGTTGSLVFNWRPTGKTSLTIDYSREFGPAFDVVTASSSARTLTIAPTWVVTDKVTLLGTLRRQERDYHDPLGLVVGGSNRQDTIDAYGLVAVYNPISRVYVNLSAQREKRDSNIAGQDYTVDVLSATVQWSF